MPSPLEYYILVGKTPKLAASDVGWAKWMATADRRVAWTDLGKVSVSTVFLGVDHRSLTMGPGPPLLFESLVFGGKLDGHTTRCSTWEEAEAQHAEMVMVVEGKVTNLAHERAMRWLRKNGYHQ